MRSNVLIFIAFASLIATSAALAQGPLALFEEGNALARSGVYRTALLRYGEAAAAGFDTPLLHFNVGVVYYELGEFAAAADEFAQAAAEPKLAPLASMNRGLALQAAREPVLAAEAFTVAADTAEQRSLRRAATNALEQGAAAPVSTTRRTRPITAPDERIGRFHLLAAAHIGQDDNVYETPADPYVDLSDPTLPLVTPIVHSSGFVPAELHAAYVLGNESGDTDFFFSYDVAGDFYEGEFANATEVDQRLAMGADIVLGEKDRRLRTLDTAFVMRTHRETNFDPDNGLNRTVEDEVTLEEEDLSDRFSYKAAGVQGEFEQRLGRWTWGFELLAERREYERTTTVANFDQELFFAGVELAYDFSAVMTLDFSLQQYRRLYDERPARDLTGALLTTNPAQEYGYTGIGVGVVRQLGRVVELEARYSRTERIDEFLGYYDYSEDALHFSATFRPTPRFDLSIGASASTYDYPRAFAFHVPAGGARELEELEAKVQAEFRLTSRLALWAELTTLDVTSTDARAQFVRSQTMLGVEWRR